MVSLLLQNKKKIAFVSFFILGLVAIRFFEAKLFYDPFLAFFKTEFQNKPLPKYDAFKLFLNVSFRYFLNAILSIGTIYVLFDNKSIMKLSFWLFIIFYIVLIMTFFIELNFLNDYLLLFYTRRFLIQPIFLILFVPAFYYQKLTNAKQNN